MKHEPRTLTQRGSALFIILIATALFGALGYAVSNMMRSGNLDKITEEKARLYANEIIDFGRSMRQSVQSMRISNFCEDTDISFTVTGSDGYQHTPAVSNSCKVFNPSGGARNDVNPATDWLDASMSARTEYGEWFFDGNHCINDIGTSGAPCVAANNDLLLILPHITRQICLQINSALDITNPSGEPPADNHDNSATKFQGTYTAGANSLISTTELDGKTAGCFRDSAGTWQNSYIFYQVLKAR